MRKKSFIFLLLLFPVVLNSCISGNKKSIDRYALVTRHNITTSKINPLNSLTAGNGEFAFTVGITGLQSFPEFYKNGIPLGTQSQWGWHSFPNPENFSLNDVLKEYKVGRDSVPYVYQFTNSKNVRKNEASLWLRQNPHRLNLGLIGLEIYRNDSTKCKISDIHDPVQQLNLWKGEIISRFRIDDIPVEVITYCHQNLDMISVRIKSDLISSGKIKIKISFPNVVSDRSRPAYYLNDTVNYISEKTENSKRSATICRKLGTDSYYLKLDWSSGAKLEKSEREIYYLCPTGKKNVFELSCLFSKEKSYDPLPDFKKTAKNNKEQWKGFWESGGAVDFSSCTDPRAFELERRVVLSQYLTKIQCSGSMPPQETGLTYNSWYGKFHMEMHWWHAIHFILWNRPEIAENQLSYYFHIFRRAKKTAELQGYEGVRWPKMTGPKGRESPSNVGTFLIWQQPHIIYFSELLYRYYHNDKAVLEKYKKLVFATADFMASYARPDSSGKSYVLGPALIPAQECFDPETTINPVFELTYWYWGLQTAQTWRERLGLEKNSQWQQVIDHLSALPVKDSLYLFTENTTDSYSNSRYLKDHPIVLGILGFLPKTKKVDNKIMLNTLEAVKKDWDWQSTWGWDFPLAAMNATLLNKPDLAVDFIMMKTAKNTYLLNGHNYQNEILTLYLPGNGALLTAVAMMCTHRNDKGTNGFPSNGKWNVRYENLHSLF